MRFYRATAFLFPDSYERRILLVCFGAVHIPLAACVALQAATGEWELTTLLTLLVATLIGSVLGLFAIHALLAPIGEATAMLQAVQQGERIAEVPRGGNDLVGRLFRGVAAAANDTATRIEQLVDAAERDPLTGLLNRRGFKEAAQPLLSARGEGVVALIDIDHFKSINDRFGHDAGDALLKALARGIEGHLRRQDVVARWGGEEFAVLLPDTDIESARLVMERLCASTAEGRWAGIADRIVTLSGGLATVGSFADLDEATRLADAALYESKDAGRNQVRVAQR